MRRQKFLRTRAQAQAFQRLKCAELAHAAPNDSPVGKAERQAIRLARARGVDLMTAVQCYLEHQQARRQSVPFAALVASRLAEAKREAVSVEYQANLSRFFARALAAWGEKLTCEITPDDVAHLVFSQPVTATTKRDYLRYLSTLFRHAQARGWAEKNPAAAVKAPKVLAPAPGILSPGQAAALLAACSAPVLPSVAIGLYAGLRMAEIKRLHWDEVLWDREVIEVPAAKSKTASRRLVRIEPVLRRILAPYVEKFSDSLAKHAIWPANGSRMLDAAKVAAGWRGRWGAAKDAPVWPDNALRHSYASYHLAHFRDAARTALELGHSTTQMLFQHYRELVTGQDAKKFWATETD